MTTIFVIFVQVRKSSVSGDEKRKEKKFGILRTKQKTKKVNIQQCNVVAFQTQ